VFWSRYQELPDWEKVIKNIERGEQKIQRQADIMAAIRAKLEQYKNPWQELKVRLSAARTARAARARAMLSDAIMRASFASCAFV
jgi:hypothetical protein